MDQEMPGNSDFGHNKRKMYDSNITHLKPGLL